MIDRRSVLRSLTAAGAAAVSLPFAGQETAHGQRPTFFDPRAFGARGDGKALDSPAINKAIDACTAAGGGIVYLPPGVYRSGTVELKSNVTLYVEAGATILGSTEMSDYTGMKGPSLKGDANQFHLIFARDAENVTLAGPGRIDGQGPSFWLPSGRKPLPEDDQWAEVTAHAYKKNPNGRPSPMLEFVSCRWLRIEGLRIENASGWTMRPINCDNVVLHGLNIKNPNYGSNTDGMDICGCQNVFISDCAIDTGDDAICFKSENPYGTAPRLTSNVTVTNCTLTTCCNGFKIGTATEGGFENIVFSNSVIYNSPGPYKDRVIAGIALETVDGGWIDGVTITNIRMQRTRTPIFLRLGNRANKHHYPQNGVRNVTISNIEASEALLAGSIVGIPGHFVENVTISNVRIENVLEPKPEWVDLKVPEKEDKYPEARMFGMLPASGMYLRHARNIQLRDIEFRNPEAEMRPTFVLDDVHEVGISNLRTTPIRGAEPVISLHASSAVWVRDTQAPANCASFLRASGEGTSDVLLSGCDLRKAKQALDPGSDKAVVTLQNNIP
ncbi:Polygalacturonase [Bryocella elongata]|uniref:Polygalacturonase n=1 Tax=Bryocella elongata TaxID=863522 RepID=A0A1H6CAT2_9BACT|nr:glycoside hydrolase family 28 protein [Bryocella elongata]SEG70081.1 Polygalacturonase [Bryocella elongata]